MAASSHAACITLLTGKSTQAVPLPVQRHISFEAGMTCLHQPWLLKQDLELSGCTGLQGQLLDLVPAQARLALAPVSF
jgi:hypothetical protein